MILKDRDQITTYIDRLATRSREDGEKDLEMVFRIIELTNSNRPLPWEEGYEAIEAAFNKLRELNEVEDIARDDEELELAGSTGEVEENKEA